MQTRLKIEVVFPRTVEGQRVEPFYVHAIPRTSEYITTDGDDSWFVREVTHIMNAGVTDVCARVGVQ